MTLLLKVHQFKFVPAKDLVLVSNAINVAMNEVILDSRKSKKTYVTDGLATCMGIVFCGVEPGFTIAFTHMSSESTEVDDTRKETVLNQMLEYMLKTITLTKVKMIISPSTVQETHLVNFILSWASKKGVKHEFLSKGADSAVFNIDVKGNPLLLSTSLTLKEVSKDKWCGHGVLQDSSNTELVTTYYAKPVAPSFFKPLLERKEEERVSDAALSA